MVCDFKNKLHNNCLHNSLFEIYNNLILYKYNIRIIYSISYFIVYLIKDILLVLYKMYIRTNIYYLLNIRITIKKDELSLQRLNLK